MRKAFFFQYASTMAFLLGAYGFYTAFPSARSFFSDVHSIGFLDLTVSTDELFSGLLCLYAAMLVPYYLFTDEESSARVAILGVIERKFGREWKKSVRALALKFFFAPLMIQWLAAHAASMLNGFHTLFVSADVSIGTFVEIPFFRFAFEAVLFADVLLFTLGYLIEWKRLGNSIVSVDPTIAGWVVCLACYPPFNAYSGMAF